MGRRLFVAVPTYNGQIQAEAFYGLDRPSESIEACTVQFQHGSLLAYVFNKLWSAAYNSRKEFGWNRFAMHHADISASPGWADVLMDEMDRTGADLMSVVVPMKDNRGLTSTGLANPKTGSIRRLTLTEVYEKLPETFDGETATAAIGAIDGSGLALNTGLWICNLDKFAPFIKEGLHFNICDGLVEQEDGTMMACALPEDWHFSRSCRALGLKIMATRKVVVWHHGVTRYGSHGAAGEWKEDRGDNPKAEAEFIKKNSAIKDSVSIVSLPMPELAVA